jgi:hypothetical protein
MFCGVAEAEVLQQCKHQTVQKYELEVDCPKPKNKAAYRLLSLACLISSLAHTEEAKPTHAERTSSMIADRSTPKLCKYHCKDSKCFARSVSAQEFRIFQNSLCVRNKSPNENPPWLQSMQFVPTRTVAITAQARPQHAKLPNGSTYGCRKPVDAMGESTGQNEADPAPNWRAM